MTRRRSARRPVELRAPGNVLSDGNRHLRQRYADRDALQPSAALIQTTTYTRDP